MIPSLFQNFVFEYNLLSNDRIIISYDNTLFKVVKPLMFLYSVLVEGIMNGTIDEMFISNLSPESDISQIEIPT